jgi:integrase
VLDWRIPQAQEKVRELRRSIDEGRDPRSVKAEITAADMESRESARGAGLTVGSVWSVYLSERRPHWGDRHYRDHIEKAQRGGEPYRRGVGTTKPGPLSALMPLRLAELDAATIEAWAAIERQTRKSSARLAWRHLTVFLTWCSEQPAYASLLPDKNPGKTRRVQQSLGKPATKSDVLQREQLKAWFAHVRQIQNPAISAALQVMLLTGARRGEVLALRWVDVDTQWKGLNIRDKVEELRIIPLTPYVESLIAVLPRRNERVFSSPTSASGGITDPRKPHTLACMAAGLDGLTVHGLRRSFASLTEWLDVPAGVVAQIQGHKPSATAEKHYKRRPLELLRLHHEKIEAWMLEQAGVQFDATSAPGALRVVSAR